MKKYNWSLGKCLEFIQNKKQDVDIPNFFLEQLYNFNIRLDKNYKGKKKDNWIDDNNFVDLDERLMRNTYVNGLPSNKNVKSEIRNKKKIKVGWADNNPSPFFKESSINCTILFAISSFESNKFCFGFSLQFNVKYFIPIDSN